MNKYGTKWMKITIIIAVLIVLCIGLHQIKRGGEVSNCENKTAALSEPIALYSGNVKMLIETISMSVELEDNMGKLSFKVPKVFEDKLEVTVTDYRSVDCNFYNTAISLDIKERKKPDSAFAMSLVDIALLEQYKQKEESFGPFYEIFTQDHYMLGRWGAVTNPYWDESDSAEYELMEQYGYALRECIVNSVTWRK